MIPSGRWAGLSVMPGRVDAGDVDGVLGTAAPRHNGLEVLLSLSADGMAMLHGHSLFDGCITWANPQFCALAHRLPEAVTGLGLADLGVRLCGDEDRFHAQLLDDGGSADIVIEVPGTRAIPARLTFARVAPRAEALWALLVREHVGEMVANEALRASEERFRALAANAPIGIFSSEAGLRFGYLNDRFAQLWGKPSSALLGMGWLDSVHDEDVANLVGALTAALAGESAEATVRILVDAEENVRWLRTRASPTWLPGHGAAFVGSVEDVTDYRRQEEALAHQATHDPLTGLPNRSLLAERVDAALGQALEGSDVALLFLDLDNFKLVNDTLGHQAGDELLLAVASRLIKGVRRPATVARLGGDEFVVLCQVSSAEEAIRLADRLQRMVARPLDLSGTEVRVTASIGVVVANDHHDSATALMRDADIAMYQAKQGGKARSAIFDERVRGALSDRLVLTGDLRRALDNGDLDTAYQPICDLGGDGALPLVAVEALVRWEHPERGWIDPSLLVSLAEESGLVDRLGELMLERACEDLAVWRRDLGQAAPGYSSVNLSPVQLGRHVVDWVFDALHRHGLSPEELCLELTETVLMGDDADLQALARLRHEGVRLAVDDFGTGYSSLSYLRRLPVQIVKIDRSFIGTLTADRSAEAIVSAIIAMSDALDLRVVAEGIESIQQLEKLQSLGCSLGQGYLLGQPQTAADLATLLVGARDAATGQQRHGPVGTAGLVQGSAGGDSRQETSKP